MIRIGVGGLAEGIEQNHHGLTSIGMLQDNCFGHSNLAWSTNGVATPAVTTPRYCLRVGPVSLTIGMTPQDLGSCEVVGRNLFNVRSSIRYLM